MIINHYSNRKVRRGAQDRREHDNSIITFLFIIQTLSFFFLFFFVFCNLLEEKKQDFSLTGGGVDASQPPARGMREAKMK